MEPLASNRRHCQVKDVDAGPPVAVDTQADAADVRTDAADVQTSTADAQTDAAGATNAAKSKESRKRNPGELLFNKTLAVS